MRRYGVGQAGPALRARDRRRQRGRARARSSASSAARSRRAASCAGSPFPACRVTRKDIDELQAFAKEWGGKGLAHLIVEPSGELRSPIAKFLSEAEVDGDPRGDRGGARLGRVPRCRLGGDRQPRARRAALAPRRALRPDRPRRLGVPVRRRLPALQAGRGDRRLGGRAPHVHGAGARARGSARDRSGGRRSRRRTTSC